MTQTLCPYDDDDEIRPDPYNSIISKAENLRCVGATHPHPLLYTTPRLDSVHTYNYLQMSGPLTVPHRDELNFPRFTHLSYSLSPAGSQPLNNTPTDLDLPQFFDIYHPWGSFQPSLNLLPDATYGVYPPTFHQPTLVPTLYPNSPGNPQVSSVDEFLSGPGDPPAISLHNSTPSPHPHLNYTSGPYSGALDASYPCLWTENGIVCNVMVQATRSHMNRHLHACHGFGGSETRPTRCYWTGCGETMQQGSIARHMVSCHLQAKVTCPMCSKKLSRQDVISKHQRVCPAVSAWR